jgi:hypothetical protein
VERVAVEMARLERHGAAGIAKKIQNDFAAGRMVSVNGWRLSKTETILYAAAYYRAGKL